MPAWINSLSKMSTGLTPSVLNNKTSLLCKYGCPVPTSSRSQQVDHEQICQSQPIQCPVVGCNFVTQLSSITPHIFLVHNTEIKYNASESFYLNFKEGRWSFENGRSLLKDGPKNLCFFQVVNGRLFLVNAMGNFEDMQVCVYVQYVNDDLNYKSSVACEVLRPDGVPLQYAGEVYPLTYSPVHIITRRQCLVFNMSHINPKVNHFVLHTNIMNEVV
ncbi:uncharacterized protein LOC128983633 [Macrosteles quadrilineatus]|uniref:uncharacterized protein LOC128983633 n=1 Tax=Macrosteles quadrilineatus TaxID=74068 RepID=UPI0023E2B68E|nr:uncharacterized protein LOC128983633 [Macrosteles quadrilineatus]